MYIQNNSEKMHYLIGQRILRKRKELGYTGSQLATILGVSQQQISRYERGKNKVDLLHLFRISIALKTPMHWFLEDITEQLAQFLDDEPKYQSIANKRYNKMQLQAEATLYSK